MSLRTVVSAPAGSSDVGAPVVHDWRYKKPQPTEVYRVRVPANDTTL